MAIYTLDFLNKNKFRRFPFRAETTLTSVDGKKISNELIVGLSITTTIDRADLYLSQIFVQGAFIDIVLSCDVEDKKVSLGRFYGTVVEDYSVLYMEQFERFVNGILIIGSLNEILKMQTGYFFNREATAIEDSTIFYYTPPAVKSVLNDGDELRGRVEFGTLTNLIKTKENKNIKLSTTKGAQVASLADKSSAFKNCPTPLIYSVNNAVPFKDTENNYPILDGNVYMIGIKPVVFYGEFGTPGEELTTGGTIVTKTIDINGNPITLDTLCTARNKVLPPINPVYLVNRPDEATETPNFKGKENYYTRSFSKPVNFIKASEPEFLSWPQFFSNYTEIIFDAAQGTQKNIVTIPQNKSGDVKRIVLRNAPRTAQSTGASLKVLLKKNGNTIPGVSYIDISQTQALVISGINVPFVSGDIFSIYLDQVDGTSYTLQTILFYR